MIYILYYFLRGFWAKSIIVSCMFICLNRDDHEYYQTMTKSIMDHAE